MQRDATQRNAKRRRGIAEKNAAQKESERERERESARAQRIENYELV